MKSVGVVRKVDELGRVVLPKELRGTLNMPEGTPLEVYVDGESIILKKYEPGCVFCGDMEITKVLRGKKICASCMNGLK